MQFFKNNNNLLFLIIVYFFLAAESYNNYLLYVLWKFDVDFLILRKTLFFLMLEYRIIYCFWKMFEKLYNLLRFKTPLA